VKITYAPRDGEQREWVWKPAEMESHEAELIEDAMDLPYMSCVSKFLAGSTRARRALLWVLLRRDHPALQFDQVRFRLDEVASEFDEEELARIRDHMDDDGDGDPLDDAAREALRETLAEKDAADQAAEQVAGVDPGKDTAVPAAAGSST
jgi:hypothetical protein